MKLQTAIVRGVEDYLTNTFFGALSLWRHGQRGKTRALRARELAENETIDGIDLLWAILESGGKKLRTCIARRVAYSGEFADTLAVAMLRYSELEDPDQRMIEALHSCLSLRYPRGEAVDALKAELN